MQKKCKTFLFFIFFILYACGLPNDEPFLEPPKVDKRLNSSLNTLTCSFFNVDEQNALYPNYLKGFNVYYRVFDPQDNSDAQYIQSSIIDSNDNLTKLVNLAASSLNNTNIERLNDFQAKKTGVNGFFRLFSSKEVENAEIITHVPINNFTREKNVKISFEFTLTNDELGIKLSYKNYTSATDTGTDQNTYLYRFFANEPYETIDRLRGFNNNIAEIKEYSFRPNDVDLLGPDKINNSFNKGITNAEYYVGLWVISFGSNFQFKRVYSKPIFLGFRKLDVNFSGIKEDSSFSKEIYDKFFK